MDKPKIMTPIDAGKIPARRVLRSAEKKPQERLADVRNKQVKTGQMSVSDKKMQTGAKKMSAVEKTSTEAKNQPVAPKMKPTSSELNSSNAEVIPVSSEKEPTDDKKKPRQARIKITRYEKKPTITTNDKKNLTCSEKKPTRVEKKLTKARKRPHTPASDTSIICTRCLHPTSERVCRVPHPEHLRVHAGSEENSERKEKNFDCPACHASWITVVEKKNEEPSVFKNDDDPKLCYEGEHTTKPLRAKDKCRVYEGLVSIAATDTMQANIEKALSPENQENVKILCLSDRGGWNNKIPGAVLNHQMTNLTTLKMFDVFIAKLHLTQDLTPNLTSIDLRQIEGDVKVELPSLKHFKVFFYWSPPHTINTMLRAADKLETFVSYKLRCDQLVFASEHLKTIDIQRNDILQELTIWAPNLKKLKTQGCYSLVHGINRLDDVDRPNVDDLEDYDDLERLHQYDVYDDEDEYDEDDDDDDIDEDLDEEEFEML